jgi:hypothetical protein
MINSAAQHRVHEVAGLSPTRDQPSVDEVARRVRRFEETKDPAVIYPRLAEAARVAAGRELERVTQEILAGREGVWIDPGEVHDPYALAIAGHTTGMAPLVGRWIEDGTVDGRSPVRFAFLDYLSHARRRAARIEREALPALDALVDRGLEPVVLKGFHTARVYYEEPAVRRMGDVDLAVPANRVADAEAALAHAGFRPDSEALRPYKRDWIGNHVDPRVFSLELPDERTRWVVELHGSLDRHLHPGAVARLDAESGNVEPFDIAGRRVWVAAQPLLLVSLACHCSQELDASRLLRLFEIVRIVRSDSRAGRLSWDDVLGMLRRTANARYTYPAFALAEELAPGTIDPRVLSMGRKASTWAARHTVARLVPAGGSPDSRGALKQLMWTSGTLAVAHRIVRNVWPASFARPGDVIPGWRVRFRRLRSGLVSLGAPDERRTALTPDLPPQLSPPARSRAREAGGAPGPHHHSTPEPASRESPR